MRNFLIIAICSVLAWVASQPLHAQYTDTEFWLGSGVSQSINKDLSWSLQWENRWTQGMRWHDQGLVDAALEYDLNKHWSLNAQWRFSERQLAEGGYATRRRGALRLLGDWKAGGGKVKGRLMWTESWNPLLGWEDIQTRTWEPTTRMRLGYVHALASQTRAEVSWELFYRGDGQWSERRQASASWDVSKYWAVGASYMFGNTWKDDDPWRAHVLRIKTTWTLPSVRKIRRTSPPARIYKDGNAVGSRKMSACPPCKVNQLRLTEVNGKGEPADFIELLNEGDAPCDLKGWRITEALDRSGWTFPSVVLPASACWLGFEGGRNSFDFGISADGETLFLIGPNGVNFQKHLVLESTEYRSQGVDKSGVWNIFEPSPGLVEYRK